MNDAGGSLQIAANSSTQKAMALLDSHGEHFYDMLYRLTLRHDVAEDLLQELACAVLKSDACWAADDSVAYASRMAMNLAFDWRKKTARARNLPPDPVAPTPGSPLQDVLRREEYEQALKALSELPELPRECLMLRHFQDQSYEEIAQKLGKTAAHVRSICSKGLAELRDRMNTGRLPDGKRV